MFLNNSRNKKIKFLTLEVLTFCKDVPEAYLELSRTSTIKFFFYDFLKKAPPWIIYRVPNKPLHTSIHFSPIETIYIINIFAVKYLFLTKE